MMVRTRQRARLEAAQEAKTIQYSQEELVEENVRPGSADDDKRTESSSSEDSEGDLPDKDSPERLEQSDNEPEKLPDVLTLERSDRVLPVPPREKVQMKVSELSSSLDPGPEMKGELYFSFDVESVVSRQGKARISLDQGGRDPHHKLMKKSVITPDFEKRESAPPISQSRYAIQRMKKAERERSAGGRWFDLPAPQLTPELKNDLKLLRMRNALDPARHYKTTDSKTLPRYFQVGRVESGPADFYSGRLPARQRKQTLVDELLASEESRRYHKKKYLELQSKFMNGTKRLRNIKHKKKYKAS